MTHAEIVRALETLRPGALYTLRGDTYAGITWLDETAMPTEQEITAAATAPTVADVIAERERRFSLGFDYDFGDGRGTHRIGTTEADMKGWSDVTTVAQALMALGNTSTTISIVTNTGPCSVTAPEWMAVLIGAAQHRQPLWAASFVLQAMSPIPADYADDSHWQ